MSIKGDAMTDRLPGEGETRTTTEMRVRYVCDQCGEPATKRVAYLLDNCRSNPGSSAYHHDDCSWCSDAEAFACDAHEPQVRRDAPDGMTWAATFPADNFPHMMLYWIEVKS